MYFSASYGSGTEQSSSVLRFLLWDFDELPSLIKGEMAEFMLFIVYNSFLFLQIYKPMFAPSGLSFEELEL